MQANRKESLNIYSFYIHRLSIYYLPSSTVSSEKEKYYIVLTTADSLIRETDKQSNDDNKRNKQWVLWRHKGRHLISSIREDFPGEVLLEQN